MLSDEQMGYVLQIRDTKPPLSYGTVRIMLQALHWSPDEIKRAINFLKNPPEPTSVSGEAWDNPKPPTSDIEVNVKKIPNLNISIKQNPFPVGSPLLTTGNILEAKSREYHLISGAVLGFLILVAGIIAYGYFSGVL